MFPGGRRESYPGRAGGGETKTAAGYLPKRPTLDGLREAAAGCRGCHLWERWTQTVFGEGAARAGVMLVGEQPGDQEDVAGKPFVGPDGRLLDQALEEAGIDRSRAVPPLMNGRKPVIPTSEARY